jgi:hypothetical protein
VSAVVVCALAGVGLIGAVPLGSAALAAGGQPPSPATPGQSPHPAKASPPARSSCRSLVHIGDSTSDGLISRDYLPDPQERLAAQYARVGVTRLTTEISGGRSIVETVDGQPDAYTVAQQLVRDGYRGCWVLALGVNDTADVYVGSSSDQADRIRRMMSVAGGQPVMWVNVKSLVASGPYAESQMQVWNSALMQACARYPNMRVYDWAAAAQDSWFIRDGIHYTSAGYAARARLIASALAAAFPAGRLPAAPSPGCLVH